MNVEPRSKPPILPAGVALIFGVRAAAKNIAANSANRSNTALRQNYFTNRVFPRLRDCQSGP
jgi:hypothetical protein